jgi:hypothetical protein
MTAVVLVLISKVAFPQIQEYTVDVGLRVEVLLDRLRHGGLGAAKQLGETDQTFTFVDLDPEVGVPPNGNSPPDLADEPSLQACAALAATRPDKYTFAPSAPVIVDGKVELNCSPSRPINRHLLAELIRRISAMGPRVLVVDVIVASEPGVTSDAERNAIKTLLSEKASQPESPPWLWVDPNLRPAAGGLVARSSRDVPIALAASSSGVFFAPAWSLGNQPIRRYAKCVTDIRSDRLTPTLPYLMSTFYRERSAELDRICEPSQDRSENSPRIIFSLPGNRAHEDDRSSPARAASAHYHAVYSRCLAAAVLSSPSSSACSSEGLFRGRIVVIGASSPERRDRYFTPLGDMAGAEVTINAARSFGAFPRNRDKTVPEALGVKALAVCFCAVVWFFYFVLSERLRGAGGHGVLRRAGLVALRSALFVLTVLLVVALSLYIAYRPSAPSPSVDVVIPAMAIALEVYIEKARDILDGIEHRIFAKSP